MAKAKLKVLMLERVAGVGKMGDIVEVSYSQARNLLIPKKLAREVTPEEEVIIKKKESEKSKNTREVIHSRHIISEKLHNKELKFLEKGQSGKMFGGIQDKVIIEKIKKEFGVTLEKKNIILPEGQHIKKEGEYIIKINLGSDVYTKMTIKLEIEE